MSHGYKKLLVVGWKIALFALIPTIAIASGEIQRNPFSRPPIEVLQEENPVEFGRQEDEWRAELRAVLVAGEKSVADLGGVILRVGENTNGYRLLSVSEDAATFNRNGERVVISLYEQDLREQ